MSDNVDSAMCANVFGDEVDGSKPSKSCADACNHHIDCNYVKKCKPVLSQDGSNNHVQVRWRTQQTHLRKLRRSPRRTTEQNSECMEAECLQTPCSAVPASIRSWVRWSDVGAFSSQALVSGDVSGQGSQMGVALRHCMSCQGGQGLDPRSARLQQCEPSLAASHCTLGRRTSASFNIMPC